MGSAGRRTAAYVAARETFKAGNYPCALASGPWCTGHGTTVDHHPPLATVPHHTLWHGIYRPACPACQSRQGAFIRNHALNATDATAWRW